MRLFSVILFFLIFLNSYSFARVERFRCMLREDPSTSICIGWDQSSGAYPVLYYGTEDNGNDFKLYKSFAQPTKAVHSKGMHNCFVRLTNLQPNTTYYFFVKDSEGISRRYKFRTLPNNSSERISIISGGDSGNSSEARANSNRFIAKLKPHLVLFNGDFTNGTSDAEWKKWLDDWSESFTSDGLITPIVVARGNKEQSNNVLIDLFDVASPDIYRSMSIGGNLLKVYTLNSFLPNSNAQKNWLETDLSSSQNYIWKICHYHLPLFPDTKYNSQQNAKGKEWLPVFEKYKVNLAIDCDIPSRKYAFPVLVQNGNFEEANKDDQNGVFYLSEGFMASAYARNDTIGESFTYNHLHWIFVDSSSIEIRTVISDNPFILTGFDDKNRFVIPEGLEIIRTDKKEFFRLSKNTPKVRKGRTEIKASRAEPLRDGSIEITWQSVFEEEGMTYRIQYSTNKVYWKTIVESTGLGINNMTPHDYAFNDPPNRRTGKVYFRITAIDKNSIEVAKSEIEVRSISSISESEIVKVNQFTGSLKFDIDLLQTDASLIEIYDINRNLVFSQKGQLRIGKQSILLNIRHLEVGQYLVEIEQGVQIIRKSFMVVN